MRTLIACASLLWLSACSSNPGARGGGNYVCPAGIKGILLLDWTVRGAAAGTQSCSGIDKLSLYLNNVICGEVEIDPIQCTLDKFRYDELPEGQAEVIIQGVDVNGVLKVSGSVMVDLKETVPAAPTPVALK